MFQSIKACVTSFAWVPVLLGCCALLITNFFFFGITETIHTAGIKTKQGNGLTNYLTKQVSGTSTKQNKTKRIKITEESFGEIKVCVRAPEAVQGQRRRKRHLGEINAGVVKLRPVVLVARNNSGGGGLRSVLGS